MRRSASRSSRSGGSISARAANPERFRKFAEYLASINLSQVPRWEYALKTLPRVTGRGTHVVITEYDLPRPTIEPHDVVFADGYAWYTNFGEEYIGRLDPKTGQHKEFPLPELKKGFPTGSLDLKLDKDGSHVVRHDVPGRARQVRSQDREVPDLPGFARSATRTTPSSTC